MNRSDILKHLYESRDFNDLLQKMEPEHLRDDLRQDVIIAVGELPEEKLQAMHTDGSLRFWVVRTVLNMVKSDRSAFFKNYRNYSEYFDNGAPDKHEEDSRVIRISAILEGMDYFDREILKLWVEFKCNRNKVATETGISRKCIEKTVKRGVEEIRQKLKQYAHTDCDNILLPVVAGHGDDSGDVQDRQVQAAKQETYQLSIMFADLCLCPPSLS